MQLKESTLMNDLHTDQSIFTYSVTNYNLMNLSQTEV